MLKFNTVDAIYRHGLNIADRQESEFFIKVSESVVQMLKDASASFGGALPTDYRSNASVFQDFFECQHFGVAQTIKDFEELRLDNTPGGYAADVCEVFDGMFYAVLIWGGHTPFYSTVELAKQVPAVWALTNREEIS